jgi:hypothetical protein
MVEAKCKEEDKFFEHHVSPSVKSFCPSSQLTNNSTLLLLSFSKDKCIQLFFDALHVKPDEVHRMVSGSGRTTCKLVARVHLKRFGEGFSELFIVHIMSLDFLIRIPF